LAEPYSDISEVKYLAATLYTIDLGYSKNQIISICECPVQRPSIILRTRSYLLGHFEVKHTY